MYASIIYSYYKLILFASLLVIVDPVHSKQSSLQKVDLNEQGETNN